MAIRWRPRSRAIPFLPLILLLLLAPLFYSVSRLQLSWAPPPERGGQCLPPPSAPEGRQCLPAPTAPKRPDRLVLGPAAGQGRPDRLQCQGLKAVNKIGLSSERNYSGDQVTFVTVFTTYNSDPAEAGKVSSDVVTVGKHSYSKVGRSMAILKTFISFIQVSMPTSNVIILTDPNSKFSLNHGSAAILPIEGNYTRGNLMLQRIRSYIAFLEQRLEELETMEDVYHIIFTDSDIAVVTDLGDIFKIYPNCHLALTFRNNKGQPLNSGFVAVRGTRDGVSKAIEFFKEVLEAYQLNYMKASRMLGDQLALAWVVKSHLPSAFRNFSKHEAFTGEVNGASILFLPCAVYNWTPPEGAGQFHGMPLDVKLILLKRTSDSFKNSEGAVAEHNAESI
uniref:Nucleotide-diphospho-sugar transferase domain-containing protein n=1 Tax=Leersia perrieri TaxID=77586 RepID=A0A0D9WRD6_9ORYZ